MKIRMSSPDLSGADREAVNQVVQTPNLSMGPKIDAFERAFCDLTGAKHAIGVNSGTAGLHLCVRAADIGVSDVVITTPFSFVASTNVILFEKAVPVFVDVDPLTGNIDTELLEQAVEDLSFGGESARRWLPRKLPAFNLGGLNSVKAVLPIDVFGQPADYDPIIAIANQYDLTVIEDPEYALPPYDAVLLVSKRMALNRAAMRALRPMVQSISSDEMRTANGMVDVDGRSVSDASAFLAERIE